MPAFYMLSLIYEVDASGRFRSPDHCADGGGVNLRSVPPHVSMNYLGRHAIVVAAHYPTDYVAAELAATRMPENMTAV